MPSAIEVEWPSDGPGAVHVLLEALAYAHERVQFDRPIALREAIMSCRSGGTVSVIGVYAGLIDKFPMNAVMNRSLTIKTGQCHVHRYMKPLLERIQKGEIDPSFVISHKLKLSEAPTAYANFNTEKDTWRKVVLSPN